MSVTALPLDVGAQARTLLHHVLENGDLIGSSPPLCGAERRDIEQVQRGFWSGWFIAPGERRQR
jgi:hypothetical protein